MARVKDILKDVAAGCSGAEEVRAQAAADSYESGWRCVQKGRLSAALYHFDKCSQLGRPAECGLDYTQFTLVLASLRFCLVDIDGAELFEEYDCLAEAVVARLLEARAVVDGMTAARLDDLLRVVYGVDGKAVAAASFADAA